MLLDSQNLFSDAQSITTGTIQSANIVKFGDGDISYLPLLIQVVADFSKLTSLTCNIITSATEDFSEATTLASSKMVLADLKSGNTFPISYMPKGNLGYIKLTYVVEGTAETTGKITAGVTASCE